MNAVDGLIAKYQDLFEKGYGHLKQFKASIQVREDAQPIFLKARPVPYALKEKSGARVAEVRGRRDHLQGEPK